MKLSSKKNKAILILTIAYVLFWIFFPWNVHDTVTLSFHTTEVVENPVIMQLFWDGGIGFDGERSLGGRIGSQNTSITLEKEQLKNLGLCRWDPSNLNADIAFDEMSVNGKRISLKKVYNAIQYTEMAEVTLTENESEEYVLSFQVQGYDSQVYFDESFTELLTNGQKLEWSIRWFWIILGIAIAGGLTVIPILEKVNCTYFSDRYKKRNILDTKNSKLKIFLCIMLFAIISFCVMWQYVLGVKFFIFDDAGDSLSQVYPELLSIARSIETGQKPGTYDFTWALGYSREYYKIGLTNWVTFLGEENVAYLLGISQFIKIILSGIFFYFFLKIRGKGNWYSAILGLGYAFCGHMTLRSSWTSYPNEVVLVAFSLMCIELWLQKNDFRWIPFAIWAFMYEFAFGSYQSIMYIVLLVAYVIFRYFSEKKIVWKKVAIISILGVVGCILFGLATKFQIINTVLGLLNSDRAQSNMGVTGIFEWDILPRAFARTIGVGTIGIIGKNYTGGYLNSLEDPTFYCGIFTLLLLPLAFYSLRSIKQKVCYCLVTLIAFVFCVSLDFRTFVNGFSGKSFKLWSLWIIIFMLYLSAQIDWEKLRNSKTTSTIICSITALTIFIMSHLLHYFIEVDSVEIVKIMIFIAVEYLLILGLIRSATQARLYKFLLLICVCVEVVVLSYPSYNDRKTVSPDFYYDDTISAIEFLNEKDDAFYRVDKQYVTGGECDSRAQNYNGTAYYIGGVGPNKGVTDFYDDFGLPGTVNDNRRAYGTSSQNEIQTLLGIKYALTNEGQIANYGYEHLAKTGDVDIYENRYAVPFGFVYTKYISRENFEKLNMNQRQQAILEACLTDDADETDRISEISEEDIQSLSCKDELFDKYEIEYTSTEAEPFYYDGNMEQDCVWIEANGEDELIAIQVTFEKASKGYLFYQTMDGKRYTITIEQEKEHTGQIYEINVPNVNCIGWSSPSWSNITSLRIAKVPKVEYYDSYLKNVEQIQKNAVELTQYEDNYIEGVFEATEDGILYLPVVKGDWYIAIDGEWQDNLLTVNDAFVGVYVTEGSHSIAMKHLTGNTWDIYKEHTKKVCVCVLIFILGSVYMNFKRKRGLKNEGYISSSTGA